MYEEGHRDKLDQRAWEGVLVGYNNDSPTYRIYGNANGKIGSSRNVTSIECVESNTPSMVDDIDEGSRSSDDLENVYQYDRIRNLESTTLDDVEGSHCPVHQYNRMTLQSRRKSKDNLAEAKSLASRESRSENQLAMSTLETVRIYIYTVNPRNGDPNDKKKRTMTTPNSIFPGEKSPPPKFSYILRTLYSPNTSIILCTAFSILGTS